MVFEGKEKPRHLVCTCQVAPTILDTPSFNTSIHYHQSDNRDALTSYVKSAKTLPASTRNLPCFTFTCLQQAIWTCVLRARRSLFPGTKRQHLYDSFGMLVY
ncbi:predicted protein [Verticillium alfalfae VaMs.102]|uniref:Predicted protein n=1 Tax=Verticillium alfalfae (strain VaMs.102 / ATCC MYA-4576 / FGSC 10136) TaxID=526221 RepID=C9SPG2_VERA1|nr:predicted protein [Verticillium alfalfae VaMs.102]EEY20677.1 predicted protein [Verticillium alfalfae VaMs.102]